MPEVGLRQKVELETRNRYTKVDCEFGMKLNGRELPNMAVLGEALEKAAEMIQEHIKQSYEVVPERDNTTPVAHTPEAAKVESEPEPVVARDFTKQPPNFG
jgi:hypothetical protein